MPHDTPRSAKPWLFGVLILPLGVYTGFIWTPLPFLLNKSGIPVDEIARIEALLLFPPMLLFLWTPLVDVGLRRRTWLLVGASATALCLWATFPLLGTSNVGRLTALLLSGGVFVALSMAACGGLMVTQLSALAQAKASAWNQAGQLGGGALAGAAVLWLSERLSPSTVGLITAAAVLLPALAAATIVEQAPARSSSFHDRFSELRSEAVAVLRRPELRWSVVLLVAPACTGAAQALLPAIADTYDVGAAGVAWTNGLGGGIVLGLGSLLGALIPGSWDRRVTYAGAGLANGLAALVLLLSSAPTVYFAGTLLYLLTQGLCWARFVALLISLISSQTRHAGTWYSIFVSAGTIPQALMTWLDGIGYRHFGVHGLLWTDASANFLVFATVASIFAARRWRGRKVPTFDQRRL
jgi:hypothetical protein